MIDLCLSLNFRQTTIDKKDSASSERFCELVNGIVSTRQDGVSAVVALLRGILLNVLYHTEDAKYRKISADKVPRSVFLLIHVSQLMPKLDGVNGAIEFLEAVGFQRTSTHFLLPSTVSVSFCSCCT